MNLTVYGSLVSPTVTIICMCFPECFGPKSLQQKGKKKSRVFIALAGGITLLPDSRRMRTPLQSNQAVRIEYFQLEGSYKDHLVQLSEQFRVDHKDVKDIVQMFLEH